MRRGYRTPLAAAAALLLLSAACERGEDPGADPVDEPAETTDEPTDEPTAEADADIAATFEEIVEQVAELRGLEPEEDLPLEVVTSEELVEVAMEAADEQLELIAETEAILIAMHLLPEDADLRELQGQLLEAGAAGLYDHDTGISYVVGDEGELSPMQRVVVAHEVVHALQDQRFDLGRLDDLVDDPDAAMAFMSVVEGDAMLLQEEWAQAHLSEEEQQERQQEEMAEAQQQMGALQELPPAMVQSFVAPYALGPPFLEHLRVDGGMDAVDAALKDPPRTMVEVLDPDLYVDGFTPEEVEVGSAPDGWDELDTYSSGAFDVLLLLELADGHQPTPRIPTAWRGGRLAAWERDGEVTVAVAWTFADPEAAEQMCGVVPDWYATVADGEPTGTDDLHEGPRDTLAMNCDDRTVRFALAPDAELAQGVVAR